MRQIATLPLSRDERRAWLAENAEAILEVLEFARHPVEQHSKNKDRDLARIYAIRELAEHFRSIVTGEDWIPIRKLLPPRGRVLAIYLDGDGDPCVGLLEHYGKDIWDYGRRVIFWLPAPTVPEKAIAVAKSLKGGDHEPR